MNLAETYQDTFGQKTPEPMPVMISVDCCKIHGFNLISTPRDSGTGEDTAFKCPLRACNQ